MEIRYFKHYSSHLGRDMEFKVYGSTGKPILFIPCQGGRFFDFENFKMIDYFAQWIEEGKCTVYSMDCIDNETYADVSGNPRYRIEQHERWFHYAMEELVPYIRHLSGLANGYDQGIITFGCSMGAMHAANFYFRRPDLFSGCLAISGLYDSIDFFGSYMDDLVYDNSPAYYLANLPWDHPYRKLYAEGYCQIVVGQGAWEDILLASTRKLEAVMQQNQIPGKVDYWGFDVNHDWDWWYVMVQHYIPMFLN